MMEYMVLCLDLVPFKFILDILILIFDM
jgi:hypothetical protein